MNHLYVSTYQLPEALQAGHDQLRLRPVPPDAETGADVIANNARINGTGESVVYEIPRELDPTASRSNCAPAYYLGRPASLWINVMKPRRMRTAAGLLG